MVKERTDGKSDAAAEPRTASGGNRPATVHIQEFDLRQPLKSAREIEVSKPPKFPELAR